MVACEQTLHLGESREFTREPHMKGDVKVLKGLCHSLVLLKLALLPIIAELARRLGEQNLGE